ncbi:uncharacterized protein LOC100169356 [Acyrthosiphon pisum]|uniref:DDE Tnp4 domain-containing protein n=1 Tax=Acyrthosiphon pisum TaxID=7029 RepID=A0A8R2JW94_ACYPI|nr:uncharacterized protein LOC100169356 [Acyrthosiphon pisum]
MWQFPNCLGAMDGKHITFRPRRADGAFYHNYKGTDSIVLLGVCDAKYRFICVDVGQTGRMSDGGVYNNSKLSSAIKTNALNFPDDITFPNSKSKIVVPHVFIADDAFALSERLMKPFRNRLLTKEELIYNYRVSRARRVIENAFGILANR